MLVGFLLGTFVALFTTNLLNEKLDKSKKRKVSLITFIVNTQLWIYVAYIMTDKYFNNTISERIGMIGTVFVLFSLTQFSNPTLLWIYSGITYSLLFTFFLYYFKVEEQDDY